MPDDLHELSALYALDVLEADERARFEEHLAGCDRCATELAGLEGRRDGTRVRRGAAAAGRVALADPDSRARGALERRRPGEPSLTRASTAVALAVAASAAAVGFGIWAATLHHSLSRERAATSVLRDPHARHIDLQGTPGELVVAPSGDAVLTVALPSPPKGKHLRSVGREPGGEVRGCVRGRPRQTFASRSARCARDGHARAESGASKHRRRSRSCARVRDARTVRARRSFSFPATCTRSCPSALHVTKQRGRESCTQQSDSGGLR